MRSTKPRSANNTLINNFFLNCDLAAFQWTIVPGSGLTNALIANNTFVNSKLYTGTINSGNRIINNIFTTSGTVPSKSGLSWSNNLWQGNRPANAIGPGDIHADPLLAKTGSTEAGKLTAEYFMLKTLSPAIGKGIILPEVTADYFKFIRTSSPTIGGHEYGSIADKDAPTTPTNLNASEITSTSCILNWTASTDNVGVVSYDIYLSGVLSGSSSENTMTLKGLIPSTNYKITVKAKDAIGNVSEICPEINVTTEANSNLALNRPVTMSGIEKVDNDGKFAVDGEATTRWASAFSDPGWISVDLGANYHISRVVLNWEAAYGIAYKIQVSNDAVEWTDIYSTTTGIGGIVDLAGLNGVGRYVRMFGTVRTIIDGASYGYSLYELEAYGELATLFTPVETPKMSIYPNPAYNYLTVELSSQKNNEVIQIYNASGKIVLEQNVSAPIQQISIARLLPGFYFARINDDPKGAQQFIKLQ